MAENVSPCCGYEYSEVTFPCGCEMYQCDNPKCKEHFDEPMIDYEYRNQRLDDIAEARADEMRDMGN